MTQYTFSTPGVNDRPAILPDSTGPAAALFKYYAPRARGVNVFQLQDGTFVQDTPTVENQNSQVPYPIGSPDNLVNIRWDPFALEYVEVTVANPVVLTYYGGHEYVIDAPAAAALISAGYGAYVQAI